MWKFKMRTSFEKHNISDITNITYIGFFYDLIKNNVNLNIKDEFGCSYLHYLSDYYPNIEILSLLIKNHVNINIKDIYHNTPLHLICSKPKNNNLIEKYIIFLINNGASIIIKNINNETPLHCLCLKNPNIKCISFFFKKIKNRKININLYEDLFHYLCKSKYLENKYIDLLINEGISPNIKDQNGMTLLHLLCGNFYNFKYIKRFCNESIDLIAKDNNGRTCLHENCIYNPDIKCISFLLKINKKLLNLKDKQKNNALHLLCANNSSAKCILFLINKGISIYCTNDNGNNALHLLCMNKPNVKCISILINAGIDIKIKNKNKETALFLLCKTFYKNNNKIKEFKFIKCLSFLIKKYANINYQDTFYKICKFDLSYKTICAFFENNIDIEINRKAFIYLKENNNNHYKNAIKLFEKKKLNKIMKSTFLIKDLAKIICKYISWIN